MNKRLINKIQTNTELAASVELVCLGHVGPPHALGFAEVGIKMLGFAIDQAKGALIDYADPWVSVFPKMGEHHFDLSCVALTPESIASYEALLIPTNHDVFDYDMIQQHARLIVHTRGVYFKPAANVVKA